MKIQYQAGNERQLEIDSRISLADDTISEAKQISVTPGKDQAVMRELNIFIIYFT